MAKLRGMWADELLSYWDLWFWIEKAQKEESCEKDMRVCVILMWREKYYVVLEDDWALSGSHLRQKGCILKGIAEKLKIRISWKHSVPHSLCREDLEPNLYDSNSTPDKRWAKVRHFLDLTFNKVRTRAGIFLSLFSFFLSHCCCCTAIRGITFFGCTPKYKGPEYFSDGFCAHLVVTHWKGVTL